MAISSVNGLIAGFKPARSFAKANTPTLVAGRPHSLWYLGGVPGAGAAAATTAGGVALSSSSSLVAGQIPHVDPGGGLLSYLARFVAHVTVAGSLLLCDRLMHITGNSAGSAISATSTAQQTINSGTLPARDDAGSTNGAGVLIGMEVATSLGAGTPALTVGYTNSAGVAGRTAANVDPVIASGTQGAFLRFALQAPDVGVKSVETFQSSATMTLGAPSLVLYRILAEIEIAGPHAPAAVDELTLAMPQVFDGCVPFLVWIPFSTASSEVNGQYIEAQG